MISRRLAALAAAALLAAACSSDRTPEVLSEVATSPAGPDAGRGGPATSTPSPSPTPAATETETSTRVPEAGADEPVSETAIAAAVAERRDGICIDPDDPTEQDHETFVLGDVVVVAVRCFTGAYQSEWTLTGYDATRGLVDLERVEQWDAETGGLVDSPWVFGSLAIDAQGRLAAVTLDRGIGDCGRVQHWYAERDGLALARAEAQDCDAADGTTHEQGWPTVYPSGD